MGEQVISVGNQQSAIVRLEQKTNELADVVVVGYGRQKKESVIGAISTIDVAELKVPRSFFILFISRTIGGGRLYVALG